MGMKTRIEWMCDGCNKAIVSEISMADTMFDQRPPSGWSFIGSTVYCSQPCASDYIGAQIKDAQDNVERKIRQTFENAFKKA